jgi:hypothetical protein
LWDSVWEEALVSFQSAPPALRLETYKPTVAVRAQFSVANE